MKLKKVAMKLKKLKFKISRNGENIACTSACNGPNWQPDMTFNSMIEMTKNICGTSLGAILRHPRCAEVNREKMSRDTIGR